MTLHPAILSIGVSLNSGSLGVKNTVYFLSLDLYLLWTQFQKESNDLGEIFILKRSINSYNAWWRCQDNLYGLIPELMALFRALVK